MTAPARLLPLAAEPEEQHAPAEQPLGAALYALLRFRRFVLLAVLGGTLLGLGRGLMQANAYRSSGTLLLRSGTRETESAESAVGARDPQLLRPFDVLANEIQILSHRDTIRRVVEKVGADRVLEVYDPAAEDTDATSWFARGLHRLQSWWFASTTAELLAASPERRDALALETLMKNLQLGATGSSLITVSYEAHTPLLAKEIADAFLTAAEEHHREVFSNQTSLEFLTIVEAQARTAAKTAADALLEFRREHGIHDLDLQHKSILDDVTKMETQLAAVDQDLQAHECRRETLLQQLAGEEENEQVLAATPPVVNPEFSALQQQLFTLKGQQATLPGATNDRLEMERRAKTLAGQIAEVEQQLANLPRTIPGPQSSQTIKNPRYERLRSQLDTEELEVVKLRVINERQTARLEQLRSRLRQLEELAPSCESLQQEVSRHEADSRRFLENLENVRLRNLLDEHKLTNIKILEVGDLPMKKIRPNRGLWTMIGAGFGFVLGLCGAFARHRLDGSIRRAIDVESAGIGLLGVVPALKDVTAHQLGQGSLGETEHEELRRRLDGVWGTLLPGPLRPGSTSTIAMTGDGCAPGVTTLATYFAVRLARCLHVDVLLVETNYHHPTLARRLGLARVPGFAEWIGGSASREEVLQRTPVPGLKIVHAGSAAVAAKGIRSGRRPEELLRALAEGYQVVLLDVPSILDHPEFRPLVSCADVVVPVFGAWASTKEGARRLLLAIEAAGKDVPGAILNRWRSVRPFWWPRTMEF